MASTAGPRADLPTRMALPYFCAVPMRTPIVMNGLEEPIPAAGPYYLAAHVGDVVAVVKRNPNYGGTRPQRLDAIVFRRPAVAKGAANAEVKRGGPTTSASTTGTSRTISWRTDL